MFSFMKRVQSSAWIDLSGSSTTPRGSSDGAKENSASNNSPSTAARIVRMTPRIERPCDDDVAFNRLLDAYLPPEVKSRADGEIATFADALVSDQVMTWIAEAENQPVQVQHWDSWGSKKDELVTSQGWKFLWQYGTSERLAALPSLERDYEGYGRVIQMLKCHLFAPSSATSGFHLILADGVAALLSTHMRASRLDNPTRQLFQYSYDRLTSSQDGDSWVSGLWMTERLGGSDLTPTETTATYSPLGAKDDSRDADGFPLGPWVLNGLKWFSTGTEPSMAIAVARTTKGLSAFYVPMRRTVVVEGETRVELNGIRIRRLKKKVGTKPLPTSELELEGTRGWLIGTDGKGINEIGVVLNVTRIHMAVGVLGYAGRALSATRAFARVRKVARGTQLSSVPLHMRSLAKLHVAYRAQMMLSFFVTALLAKTEGRKTASPPLDLVPKSSQDAKCLLRLLGSVAKASASMDACGITQSSMESLGGVGYLENDEGGVNVARLWRDVAATLIGEGTTDVIATDVVKVVKGKIGSYVMAALGRWVKASLPKKESMKAEVAIVNEQWSALQTAVSSCTIEYLTLNGREVMERICKLSSGILLLADAARDDDAVAFQVARRWVQPATLLSGLSVEQELTIDQQIVFGQGATWLGPS